MKKKKLSDEELIFLIAQENREAYSMLFERYKRYSWSAAHKFYLKNEGSGIDVATFHSIALTAFHFALSKYNIKKQNFYPYWREVALNEMLEYTKQNSYQFRAKWFSGTCSLDELMCESGSKFDEILGENDRLLTKDLSYDNLLFILRRAKKILLPIEFSILLLLYDDFTPREIASKMKLEAKRVYYYIKTIKKKIKQILL